MLNWFRKKRPSPQAAPHEEATAPQVDEIGQDIAAGEEALSSATMAAPETATGLDRETILARPAAPEPAANDADVQPPLPLEELSLEELPLAELPLEELLIEEGEGRAAAAEDVRPLAGESAAAIPPIGESGESAAVLAQEEQTAPEPGAVETAANQEIPAPSPERPPLFAAPSKKPARKGGLFSRLAERLSRTRASFTNQLDELLYGRKEIDRKLFDELEELLITADLGYATSQEILDAARQRVKHEDTDKPEALRQAIRDKMLDYLTRVERDAGLTQPPGDGPFVIMVIGVNGVGKTTTIGKIAHKFHNAGYAVLLVAADTFRAAAISQLKIWGERGGIHVMAKEGGSDPSAVVFDAMAHAVAKNYDVVLVDTAGRLHTEQHLMEELKKIKRVMGKKLPGAPHEVLLVLDATTGQNAIAQARLFNDAVGVTGLALTKLDGTAKGGIVINVTKELGTPIRFIGVGEQLDDLRDFDAREFIDALFEGGSGRKP